MFRTAYLLVVAATATTLLRGADEPVVFRSDVTLVRVDAQVIDRDNRSITELRAEDFELREEGKPLEIRNFSPEEMPVDVLLLLDVSGSMQPHVQRLASAAHSALEVLGRNDRVGVMVFDRISRLRLPLKSDLNEVERELQGLLRQEGFNGGTDITRALHDAANYMAKNARKGARRAIVILTDDQTEYNRDDTGVSRSLARADTVLSALIAPDAVAYRRRGPGGGGGGSWPGGGPSVGGPLGGIIFGRRGGYGGNRYPGGGTMGSRTRSAGTEEIARRSGGDSMPVEDAQALDTTLTRIRQRYALHFLLPNGAKPGQERTIHLELTAAARRRHPDAEVRYRETYVTPDGVSSTGTPDEPQDIEVSRTPAKGKSVPDERETARDTERPGLRRRPAVDDSYGSRSPNATSNGSGEQQGNGGWRRVDPQAAPAAAEPEPPAKQSPTAKPASKPDAKGEETEDPPQRGWRRVKPGEQP